jgi:hypothetical protein
MARPQIPDIQQEHVKHLHEQYRNYSANSFQEALATVLALATKTQENMVPSYPGVDQPIEDALAEILPGPLKTATKSVVDALTEQEEFELLAKPQEDQLSLHVLSKRDYTVQYQIRAYRSTPERVNHRVTVRYRTSGGKMKRGGQFRDVEDGKIRVERLREGEQKNNNRNNEDAEEAADLVVEGLSEHGYGPPDGPN